MEKLCFVNFMLHLLRWVLVVLPVPGYIHPDEYFQSAEIMAGDVLNLTSVRTWEWNVQQPARNIIFPVISTGIPFWLLAKCCHNVFQLSSEILVIFPRLSMALLTLALEIALKRILKLLGTRKHHEQFQLFLFRSSHVVLIFLNHTFSNTLETLLYAVFLHNLLRKFKAKNFETNLSVDVLIGATLGLGFFVRQSIIAFAFYPLVHFGILLILSLPLKKFLIFSFKFGLLSLLGFMVAAVVCITADHYYFSPNGDWHLTVVNLIQYNRNIENLKLHGIHPWYLHFSVNMVFLFGPLYIMFILQSYKLLSKFEWKHLMTKNRIGDESCMMTTTVFISIGIMSLVPHQEPRYLIPTIVPLICSLSVSKLNTKWFVNVWITFNVVGVVFYGFLHQAGLFPSIVYMNSHLKQASNEKMEVDLIFWKTYKVPHHLFALDKEETTTRIHDLAGTDFFSMEEKLLSLEYSNRSQVCLYTQFILKLS